MERTQGIAYLWLVSGLRRLVAVGQGDFQNKAGMCFGIKSVLPVGPLPRLLNKSDFLFRLVDRLGSSVLATD